MKVTAGGSMIGPLTRSGTAKYLMQNICAKTVNNHRTKTEIHKSDCIRKSRI